MLPPRRMRPRKYPLEPLAELRDKRVDEANGALGSAVRVRDAAARLLRAAEQRREGQALAVAVARKAELDALGQGDLRAWDLARADAWGVRVAAERRGLTAEVDRAQAADTKAREAEGEAQTAVTLRRADAQVIAGHRSRWEEARRRALEAREEEAAFEAWRPKR
jgi:hypothetical protein